MKGLITQTGITEAVTRAAGVPFQYGVMDCCLFAGEAVKAQTGVNPAEAFQYASEAEAAQIIAQHGNMQALLTSVLGQPAEAISEGDVVLVHLPTIGDTVGIMGHGGVLLKTEHGVIKVKPHRIIAGWKTCQ